MTGLGFWIVIRILLAGRFGLWSVEALSIDRRKLPPGKVEHEFRPQISAGSTHLEMDLTPMCG